MIPVRRGGNLTLALLALVLAAAAGARCRYANLGGPRPVNVGAVTTEDSIAFAVIPRDEVAAGNALTNPGFEQDGASGGAAGWIRSGEGYVLDAKGGVGGGQALKLQSAAPGAVHGAATTVLLNQGDARPLYFSARSRAVGVTGERDDDYALYLDVQHSDGTWSYGHTLAFDVGSHDWQLRDRVLWPERPVKSVTVHCLLRNDHSGTAWFDDVVVAEAPPQALVLDGKLIRAPGPAQLSASPAATLASGDGLRLHFDAGGAVTAVAVAGRSHARATVPAGGFFLRDVRAGSNFLRPVGAMRNTGEGVLEQTDASVGSLALAFRARWQARADRLDVHAEIEDRRGEDRAISVYFALPLDVAGNGQGGSRWLWGAHAERTLPLAGDAELSNQIREWDIGATGAVSRYPFAGAWKLPAPEGAGVAIAHGLDQPRVVRLSAHPGVGLLYAVFDVALTRDTARFPGRAWIDFTLYRFAPAWGFRAMVQGYYDRYPRSFVRRMPPAREGTWLPFTATAKIPRIADFGFGPHETHQLSEVAGDDRLGISTFRYLQVPDSYALWLDGPRTLRRDAELERRVAAGLQRQRSSGPRDRRRQAQAILSSSLHDEQGRPVWRWSPAGVIPWCGGEAGCAFFAVSADPAISERRNPLNKARVDWSDEARASYRQHPGLDGEFVDGVQASTFRLLLDQRRSHFATAAQPLTFAVQGRHIGQPSLFATAAFLEWLAADLHGGRGKLLMGNTTCEGLPWGAQVFDHLGVESNWLKDGRFQPDVIDTMLYRRTLAAQRPFGLLLNTDFDALAKDGGVERAFKYALFYGMYLSFFSADAASNPYWENRRLVERDRPLFKKYQPIVRRLSAAGWQVVTLARSSDPVVLLERFGRAPAPLFTIHNFMSEATEVTIRFDPALKLPAGPLEARSLIDATRRWPIDNGEMTLTLAPADVEAIEIQRPR